QGLNDRTDEDQRNHALADADYAAEELQYVDLVGRKVHEEVLLSIHDHALAAVNQAVTRAEVGLEATCEATRALNDLALLLQYLYDRSVAYLHLSPPATGAYDQVALYKATLESWALANANAALGAFITDVLNPIGSARVTTDIIGTPEYDVTA